MGWLKDVFDPKGAEKERYESALNKTRQIYPKIEYDYERWKNVPASGKIAECNALDKSIQELKLLKEGKINDALISDGHRVDERYKKVYSTILNEYKTVFSRNYCNKILDVDLANRTKVQLQKDAIDSQKRIEDDLMRQRTIIIAVGGIVLLVGTVFIIRKI